MRKIVIAKVDNKIDFNSLDVKEQIRSIGSSSSAKVLRTFKQLKSKPSDELLSVMLKKCPAIIEHIKRPTVTQLKHVLDTHPHAINKISVSKRSEALVIQALRPEKRYLFGASDERASRLIKNVIALHGTPFTTRVYHEVTRLMCGAPERKVKALIATLEKQKRKIPDELRLMIKRIKSKALSSDIDSGNISRENMEVSMGNNSSIVRHKWYPLTLTVEYPDSEGYYYEYYLGSPKLFSEALKLQCNPGKFSAFVKEHNLSVKKLKHNYA